MDLQYLLDLEEIKQLRYSFSWALESSTPDALADLFTEDGVVDVGPWGRMVGQAKIRKGYGRAYGGATPFTAMHAVTNPRIRIDGDTAAATWYLLDCVLGDDPSPLKVIGIYNDKYRKVNGRWFFSELRLEFLWSADQGRITPDNPMKVLA
jgi:ketosteroid isomerase-like protein